MAELENWKIETEFNQVEAFREETDMIPVAGTIRNHTRMALLDQKWQQKKEKLGSREQKQELTAQERELKQLQEQAKEIQESREYAAIYTKLVTGKILTPEEKARLKERNPKAVQEYEEALRERESYKKQLKNCKTKEDVEKVRVNKLGCLAAQAKAISNNPCIPKAQKLQLLKNLQMRTAGLQEEYAQYIKSVQYQQLPDDEEAAEERKRMKAGETQEGADSFVTAEGEQADVTDPFAQAEGEQADMTNPFATAEDAKADRNSFFAVTGEKTAKSPVTERINGTDTGKETFKENPKDKSHVGKWKKDTGKNIRVDVSI